MRDLDARRAPLLQSYRWHTAQLHGGSLQHSDAAARRVGRLRHGRCVVTPACLAGMTGSRRSSSLCAIGRTSAAGCCHSGARTSCSSSRTTGASNAVAAGHAPLQKYHCTIGAMCGAPHSVKRMHRGTTDTVVVAPTWACARFSDSGARARVRQAGSHSCR